jgi:hypothetical protein
MNKLEGDFRSGKATNRQCNEASANYHTARTILGESLLNCTDEIIAALRRPVVPQELLRLSEKATQGEWTVFLQPIDSLEDVKRELQTLVDGTPFPGKFLPMLSVRVPKVSDPTQWGYLCPATTGCGNQSVANAELIAALVNWFRSLSAAQVSSGKKGEK